MAEEPKQAGSHGVTAAVVGLGQSAEDYLEAVYLASQSGRPARVTEIAERLEVSKPSVVSALAGLEDKGLVRHERYGGVELTLEGSALAQEVYRRHRLLEEFLVEVLGVSQGAAALDACRIEHVLSQETLRRLVRLVEFMRRNANREQVSLHRLRDCLEQGGCGQEQAE